VDLRLTRPEEVDAANPVAGDLHAIGTELALVSGAAADVQELEVRWRWWRGEWFLDLTTGTPYVEGILVKGAGAASIRGLLLREARRVPGIARVRRLDVVIDRVNRTAEVSGEAVTTSGESVGLAGSLGTEV